MGDEGHGRSGFSRRELLKRAGMVGAVAAVPVAGLAPTEAAAPGHGAQATSSRRSRAASTTTSVIRATPTPCSSSGTAD